MQKKDSGAEKGSKKEEERTKQDNILRSKSLTAGSYRPNGFEIPESMLDEGLASADGILFRVE